MADFFNTLKQGLGKGMTTVSIKSKELLDANRVKSQIAEFEKQKKDALAEMGANVCSMLDAGQVDENPLKAARGAIASFDQQIRERHDELLRIHADAQQALGLALQPTVSAPAAGLSAHCTSCGAAITPPGARFCGGCGSKA